MHLLGHQDVMNSPNSSDLYNPLLTESARDTLNKLFTTGDLSEDEIKDTVEQDGITRWNEAEKEIKLVMNALGVLLDRYDTAAVLLKPTVSLLKSSVTALAGPSPGFSDDNDVVSQHPSIRKPQAGTAQRARNLHEAFESIDSKVKSGIKIAKAREKEEVAAADANEAQARQSRSRARNNVVILNDPAHDSDYRSLSSVPLPEDLVGGTNDGALPLNLVPTLSKKLGHGGNDDERDGGDDNRHS
jgi:hypothetical protein